MFADSTPAVEPLVADVNATRSAAAALTVKLVESMLVGPALRLVAAWRVCAPAVSMRRFVNVAIPAAAETVVVPWRLPPPLPIVSATLVVASAPVVTTLPKLSSTLTTGCCPKVAPAVAEPGWGA